MPFPSQDAIRTRALADIASRTDALVAEYLARFGRVLNADNASELFADYAASPDTTGLAFAPVANSWRRDPSAEIGFRCRACHVDARAPAG